MLMFIFTCLLWIYVVVDLLPRFIVHELAERLKEDPFLQIVLIVGGIFVWFAGNKVRLAKRKPMADEPPDDSQGM